MRLAAEDFRRSVSLVSLGPTVPEGQLIHFYLDGMPWATSGSEEDCALLMRLSPAAKRSWVLSQIAARHAWPRSTGEQHVLHE